MVGKASSDQETLGFFQLPQFQVVLAVKPRLLPADLGAAALSCHDAD